MKFKQKNKTKTKRKQTTKNETAQHTKELAELCAPAALVYLTTMTYTDMSRQITNYTVTHTHTPPYTQTKYTSHSLYTYHLLLP